MIKTINSAAHRAMIEALIRVRKNAGLSQEQLAAYLKCQQSLIARIESGQRRVDLIEMLAWTRATEADPHAILSEIETIVG